MLSSEEIDIVSLCREMACMVNTLVSHHHKKIAYLLFGRYGLHFCPVLFKGILHDIAASLIIVDETLCIVIHPQIVVREEGFKVAFFTQC